MSTDGSTVWSFGDGDYGKLGHGNTNRVLTPQKIDTLQGVTARKVLCGAQFSLILAKGGGVYTCGQGKTWVIFYCIEIAADVLTIFQSILLASAFG